MNSILQAMNDAGRRFAEKMKSHNDSSMEQVLAQNGTSVQTSWAEEIESSEWRNTHANIATYISANLGTNRKFVRAAE